MCTQYSLVLLPGLIAGRLSDLGYFKRTAFISRSATGFCFPQRTSFDRQARDQRDPSCSDCAHGRMQGVLAIAPLSRSLDRVRLRNDPLSDPCNLRTVVQKTEIIGVRHYSHWSITGWNNHSDRRQKLG